MEEFFNIVPYDYTFDSKARPTAYNRGIMVKTARNVITLGLTQTNSLNVAYRIVSGDKEVYDFAIAHGEIIMGYEAMGLDLPTMLYFIDALSSADLLVLKPLIDATDFSQERPFITASFTNIVVEPCSYRLDITAYNKEIIVDIRFNTLDVGLQGIIMASYLSIISHRIVRYIQLHLNNLDYHIDIAHFTSAIYGIKETDIADVSTLLDIHHSLDKQSMRIVFDENAETYSIDVYTTG